MIGSANKRASGKGGFPSLLPVERSKPALTEHRHDARNVTAAAKSRRHLAGLVREFPAFCVKLTRGQYRFKRKGLF